ncbi:MAG: asparaginase [Tenericutes bacterium]|nr:asparaginase [Mycoplasmatota bacterium]
MGKIYMIFTGGTISMKIDDVSHTVKPALSAKQIMQSLLESELYNELEVIEYSEVPSPAITNEMMLDIAKLIKKIIRENDPTGFVIIHGTDTLEETAFFLDTIIDTEIPIVVTGSMKSSSELGFDGINNLTSSILVARATKSRGRGVLVVMNDQINAAAEVTKTNTLTLDTFKSFDYGALGIVDSRQVMFYRNISYKRKKVLVDSVCSNVYLIKSYASAQSDVIMMMIQNGLKGLVIEALGRGNLPPTMISGIQACLDKGIPVVICSRCPSGRVLDSYGYVGGGKYLTEMGCILAPSLNGQKARIQLMLALEKSNDFNYIQDLFTI